VAFVMLLLELGLREDAAAHLRVVESAAAAQGHASCMGMSWQLDRLMAPLDRHFPPAYGHVAGVAGIAGSPAFRGPQESTVAAVLEAHAQEIIAELAPLCSREDTAPGKRAGRANFGTERVVSDLAREEGSWTSLPLYFLGSWNESACSALAPYTCGLLRRLPELEGTLRSAAVPGQRVQQTFVSIYRLQPGSRLHRHVGSRWRQNTHLGLVVPPGSRLRVWNETRPWQVGKAFSFLDAAEHEVLHSGAGERCVLNVVSWLPEVVELRSSDPVFAGHFIGDDEDDALLGERTFGAD